MPGANKYNLKQLHNVELLCGLLFLPLLILLVGNPYLPKLMMVFAGIPSAVFTVVAAVLAVLFLPQWGRAGIAVRGGLLMLLGLVLRWLTPQLPDVLTSLGIALFFVALVVRWRWWAVALSTAVVALGMSNHWPVAEQLSQLLRGVKVFQGTCDDDISCLAYFSFAHWIILSGAGVLLGQYLRSRGLNLTPSHNANEETVLQQPRQADSESPEESSEPLLPTIPRWLLALAVLLGGSLWALVVVVAFAGEQYWSQSAMWSYLTQFLVAYEADHLLFASVVAVIAVCIVLLFSALPVCDLAVTSPIRALGRYSLSALCVLAVLNYLVPEVVFADDAGKTQLQVRSAVKTPPSVAAQERVEDVEYRILSALSEMQEQPKIDDDGVIIEQGIVPLGADTNNAVIVALHARLNDVEQADASAEHYLSTVDALQRMVNSWQSDPTVVNYYDWALLASVPGMADLSQDYIEQSRTANSLEAITKLSSEYQWKALDLATDYLREQGVIDAEEQQLYLADLKQHSGEFAPRFGWDWHNDIYDQQPTLSAEDYGDPNTPEGVWRRDMPDALALPHPDTSPWSTKNMFFQYALLLLLAWLWSRRYARGPVEWLMHKAQQVVLAK